MSSSGGRSDKGLLWKLPVVKNIELGKLGPGIGFGAGCGVGVGAGLFGGAGLGAGLPGLQIGIGIAGGCGIGLGFGYGVGKGIAYDENKRYSNVGKIFRRAGSGAGKFPNQEHAPSIIFMDEIDSTGSARMESGTGNGDNEVQRTMLELLNQHDGFEASNKIKVLMATNRIDILDKALLRLGRIDRKIEFPNPNEDECRSPFDYCDIVTSTTHKSLRGPGVA